MNYTSLYLLVIISEQIDDKNPGMWLPRQRQLFSWAIKYFSKKECQWNLIVCESEMKAFDLSICPLQFSANKPSYWRVMFEKNVFLVLSNRSPCRPLLSVGVPASAAASRTTAVPSRTTEGRRAARSSRRRSLVPHSCLPRAASTTTTGLPTSTSVPTAATTTAAGTGTATTKAQAFSTGPGPGPSSRCCKSRATGFQSRAAR